MINHPKRSRYSLVVMGIVIGCLLYVVSCIIDAASFADVVDHEEQTRYLRSEDEAFDSLLSEASANLKYLVAHQHDAIEGAKFSGALSEASARLRYLISQIKSHSTSENPRAQLLAVGGAGPELTGPNGQAFKFAGANERGVTWYNALSSPRFQWNVSPIRWNSCPAGEDAFLGDTGFSFHETDPLHPENTVSKYLRFRVLRKDERACLWNHSKSCLAGGNFVMNFGKSARDMLHPGDYNLKTSDGAAIRIVAYNAHRDCLIDGRLDGAAAAELDASGITPMDYVHHAASAATNPNGCEAWARQRELLGDLFSFNSDMPIVHVETPWMRIVLHVRQNKVKTEGSCVHASLNVLISRVRPDMVDGDDREKFDGMLVDEQLQLASPIMDPMKLSYRDHIVDGPFYLASPALDRPASQ